MSKPSETKTWAEVASELDRRRREATSGGGAARIERQHACGKRTARERLQALLDEGTFVERGMFVTHRATGYGLEATHPLGDGVITGTGEVDGRPVCVFAQDFTVFGGSVGEAHGRKIAEIIELATRMGVPLIGLSDSGGARIQEGVDALAGYGEVFYRNVQASGVIPQISVILGPCAGGAVYSPAITDFVIMASGTAHMFVTGPEVVRAVTHEVVGFETLGGAQVHGTVSGVAHFVAEDEDAALNQVRWLLSYLPQNNLDTPPFSAGSDEALRP
ncbi:MAG TPA: methylmalonyl-CoA carboxyltransferase, partial [Chloroflexi bacterium]|nr:methylmalonyl-CoA carboxyltransferase [Chloroflexota bacterium]